MEKYFLVINQGSSSIRAALYHFVSDKLEKKLLSLKYDLEIAQENNKLDQIIFSYKFTYKVFKSKKKIEAEYKKNNYRNILSELLALIISYCQNNKIKLSSIGIRVVCPGIYFSSNRLINSHQFLNKLKLAVAKDPLHIEPTILLIEELKRKTAITPLVAISDSAFHNTFSNNSKLYGLNANLAKMHELYRYGYHGISAQSIIRQLNQTNDLKSKIIICHLGSGSSVTAIKDGKSINSSMGFSPLEGLLSSTRSGSIDPTVALYLIKQIFLVKNCKQVSTKLIDETINFLYKKNGLLGVSMQSGEMQTLLNNYNKSHNSKNAIDLYCSKVKEYIGAYIALLNGLDMLVFTGGIGQNSSQIRELICKDLDFFALEIDKKKNRGEISKYKNISKATSKVLVKVIETDEEKEIAYLTNLVLKG